MKKPRLMIVEFNVPRKTIWRVEDFLAIHYIRTMLRAVFRNKATLMEVKANPKTKSIALETRQYTLVVANIADQNGSHPIVNLLFDHGFIPPGRMWTVYHYPARLKHLKRLNLDRNGFPKKNPA